MSAQPPNMANMRAPPGTVCRRRSVTLVSAKNRPPASASASAIDRFDNSRDADMPGGSSTSATPANASTMRSSASGVGRSPKNRQASNTDHAGIR